MSRLIDADAFKDYFWNAYEKVKHTYPDGGEWAKGITEDICKDIDNQPTIEPQKWIPCSERMPEEHDSIFSKFYGTEKWRDAMFRKTSKIVITTVEHLDGTRQTAPCHTIDGEWNQSMKGMGKALAWMSLPEPYKEGNDEIN